MKWWHFQILLLAELLSSVGLVFLIGVYKYGINETHPLGEGSAPRLWSTAVPPHLPNGAYNPSKPALASAVKNAFSSTWIWIFLPFHLKLGCSFPWNIPVLPDAEGLIGSPGIRCTGLKPGSWPLFAQHRVLCGSTWEMMAMPVEKGAAFARTTAARFCFLCQQDIAVHPRFSTVWLEVGSIRLLAKSLD